MRKFEIQWLDGSKEIVEGNSISDAFMRAGYGGGAIRAIDSWKEIKKRRGGTYQSYQNK